MIREQFKREVPDLLTWAFNLAICGRAQYVCLFVNPVNTRIEVEIDYERRVLCSFDQSQGHELIELIWQRGRCSFSYEKPSRANFSFAFCGDLYHICARSTPGRDRAVAVICHLETPQIIIRRADNVSASIFRTPPCGDSLWN